MPIEFRCQECGVTLSADAIPTSPVTCPKCGAAVDPNADDPEALLEEEGEAIGTGALASMAMPWAISGVFHLAMFLAMLFVVLTVREQSNLERIIIPSARLSRNPGGAVRPAPQRDTRTAQNIKQMRKMAYQRQTKAQLSDIAPKKRSDLRIVGIGGAAGGSSFGLRIGGGTGPKASFLGSGGNAYKIVFVIDRSGSMIETFDYVKAELRKSINALQARQSFHVIFFSFEKPVAMKPKRLVYATTENKKRAFAFIDSAVSEGQTKPARALEAAFKVRGGPPELIYFMTDGEFDKDVVARIRVWNKDKKVKINTIAFLYPSGEALLKQIAKENGGRYKFVSQDELGG